MEQLPPLADTPSAVRYRVDVLVDAETTWTTNAFRSDTLEEAEYTHDLHGRWMLMRCMSVMPEPTPQRQPFAPG